MAGLYGLPNEIILEILCLLHTINEVASVSRTSRILYRLIKYDRPRINIAVVSRPRYLNQLSGGHVSCGPCSFPSQRTLPVADGNTWIERALCHSRDVSDMVDQDGDPDLKVCWDHIAAVLKAETKWLILGWPTNFPIPILISPTHLFLMRLQRVAPVFAGPRKESIIATASECTQL